MYMKNILRQGMNLREKHEWISGMSWNKIWNFFIDCQHFKKSGLHSTHTLKENCIQEKNMNLVIRNSAQRKWDKMKT